MPLCCSPSLSRCCCCCCSCCCSCCCCSCCCCCCCCDNCHCAAEAFGRGVTRPHSYRASWQHSRRRYAIPCPVASPQRHYWLAGLCPRVHPACLSASRRVTRCQSRILMCTPSIIGEATVGIFLQNNRITSFYLRHCWRGHRILPFSVRKFWFTF